MLIRRLLQTSRDLLGGKNKNADFAQNKYAERLRLGRKMIYSAE
jgi:hypothetical protein